MSKEHIIGIDLGTTNSCVAVMEAGKGKIISSSEGGRTIPSVVSWKKDGERIVGATAKRSAVTNPQNTIYSVKRFMGHSYSEVKDEVSKVPYAIEKNKKGLAVIKVPAIDKTLTPEEISAAILQKCKNDAEAYLGEKVTKAVVTVPAYFNDTQRQATKNAGEICGLEIVRIINEPTSAALAYGIDKNKDEIVLVYDLGGGTFDVSVLQIGDGTFEVLSTSGDSHLGGDDFDDKITEYIISEFKKEYGVDLRKDLSALSRIKDASEKAKIELSSQASTNVNLPFIRAVDNEPIHFTLDITRSKFESLVKDLMDRIEKPILDAMKDGVGGDKSKINEVILVGGSSRIPCVQEQIKKLIGLDPNKGVNPDEAVALGAAIQGGILAGDVNDIVLLDVTPLSLSIEVNGAMVDVLITKNTAIPTKKKSTYTTATNNQTEVTIHIIQGERPLAKDNKSLGQFNLTGILPAPARVPQIEVSFDLDANGILSVNAKDLGTGSEQKITISNSSNLSEEEINQMIKDAEEYAEADKEAKEIVLIKNEIEGLCISAEQTFNTGDNLNEELVSNVKSEIEKSRVALTSNDKSELEEARNSLLESLNKLSAEMYKEGEEETEATSDVS
mgnify:FL=1